MATNPKYLIFSPFKEEKSSTAQIMTEMVVMNSSGSAVQSKFARTSKLDASIKKNFKNFSNVSMDDKKFIFQGSDDYVFPLYGFSLNSKIIISEKIRNNQQVTICDVGAGDGVFAVTSNTMFKGKALTYSVMSNDFDTLKELDSKLCFYGNAEYLSELCGLEKFDLIFSRATFIHYTDIIGSLIESFKTLKFDGIIFIDRFYIPGCNDHLQEIIDILKFNGYRVMARVSAVKSCIENFILQKTENRPELIFPVEFVGLDEYHGRAIYKVDQEALNKNAAINKNDPNDIYQKGIVSLEKMTKASQEYQNCYAKISDKYSTLPALLSDRDYQDAPYKQQYFMILSFVAKNIKEVTEIQREINSISEANPALAQKFRHVSSGEIYLESLFSLSINSNILSGSSDSVYQEIWLKYFAIRDIISLENKKSVEEMLIQMNLPRKEYDPFAGKFTRLYFKSVAALYQPEEKTQNEEMTFSTTLKIPSSSF